MMAMEYECEDTTSGENLTSKLTRGLYRDPHRFNEIDEQRRSANPYGKGGSSDSSNGPSTTSTINRLPLLQ
jgi:hypothetical protein